MVSLKAFEGRDVLLRNLAAGWMEYDIMMK